MVVSDTHLLAPTLQWEMASALQSSSTRDTQWPPMGVAWEHLRALRVPAVRVTSWKMTSALSCVPLYILLALR